MRTLSMLIVLLVILGCGDEGGIPTLPVVDAPNAITPQNASADIIAIVAMSDNVQFSRVAEIGVTSTVVIWKWEGNSSFILKGTGFIIDKQKIATAYHVVDDFTAQDTILIHPVTDHQATYKARISKVDPNNDLAILSTSKNIECPALTLGNTKDIFVGQKCYVVSNPWGIAGSFTEGIISGIRETGADKLSRIQFSAPISHGSSGAALLDEYGNVIGVVKSIMNDANDAYLAIPVNYLKKLME